MRNTDVNWRERFVTHLFRLVKLCRFHDLENEAARKALDQSAATFREIFEGGAEFLDVVFAGDEIFVNGEPLRASRSTYDSVLELGGLIGDIGYNEVTIRPGVDVEELEAMLERYSRELENLDEERPPELHPAEHIRFRRIDPEKVLSLEGRDQTAREQVLALYPAAIVTMRRFLDELREGELRTLRFAKRLSQRLVALSDAEAETMLALTAMKKTRDEPAGIAVNSAILALLMARRVTGRYRILHRACFGGMVATIGEPRAAGLYDRDETLKVMPTLDRDAKEQLGPLNALLLMKHSQMRYPALRRAVVAYEAGWLAHKDVLGWPWGEKQRPTVEAVIVETARRFWETMALTPDMQRRPRPSEVFDRMRDEAETKVEHVVVQLAMDVMGYYERGLIVETSTGWSGVVVEPGEELADFSRPVVRMARDADRNSIEPRDVDLSSDEVDVERYGSVRRALRAPGDSHLQEVAAEIRTPEWHRRREAPTNVSRPSARAIHTGWGGRAGSAAPPEQSRPREEGEGAPNRVEIEALPEQSSRPGSRSSADFDAPESGPSEESDGEVVMEFGPGSTDPTTHTTKPIPEQLAERSDAEDFEGGSEPADIGESGGASREELALAESSVEPGDPDSAPSLEELSGFAMDDAEAGAAAGLDESIEEALAEETDPDMVDETEQREPERTGALLGDFLGDRRPDDRLGRDRRDSTTSLREYIDRLDSAAAELEGAPEREMGASRQEEDARGASEMQDFGGFPDESSGEFEEHFLEAPSEAMPVERQEREETGEGDEGRLGAFAARLERVEPDEFAPSYAVDADRSREGFEDLAEEESEPEDSNTD